MSGGYNGMSPEDWTDHMNTRLDVIYKELCEYERTVMVQKEAEEDDKCVKLMELLESVHDIYKTAKSLRPPTKTIQQKKSELVEQMELLQRSVELLKLEPPIAEQTDMNEMQE